MRLEEAVRIVSEKIDKLLEGKDTVIIAIDGNTASGKSTLAHVLQRIYIPGTNIFHTDDFNKDQIRGNFDSSRFEEEVLRPLSENREISYRRYNPSMNELEEAVIMQVGKVNIIEGLFALEAPLCKYYDLKVLACIKEKLQAERINSRNPDIKESFFTKWLPAEKEYLSADVAQRADLVLDLE